MVIVHVTLITSN